MSKVEFETFGYYKDYMVNNKFMGSERLPKPDGEYGYAGRKIFILEEDKVLRNKVIKVGTKVTTYLYPLNGRVTRNDI